MVTFFPACGGSGDKVIFKSCTSYEESSAQNVMSNYAGNDGRKLTTGSVHNTCCVRSFNQGMSYCHNEAGSENHNCLHVY